MVRAHLPSFSLSGMTARVVARSDVPGVKDHNSRKYGKKSLENMFLDDWSRVLVMVSAHHLRVWADVVTGLPVCAGRQRGRVDDGNAA